MIESNSSNQTDQIGQIERRYLWERDIIIPIDFDIFCQISTTMYSEYLYSRKREWRPYLSIGHPKKIKWHDEYIQVA